jgi:hypothetical protein
MKMEVVYFELGEALIHLESTVADIRSGELGPDDSAGLAVELCHILEHISRAWNCKDMTMEEMNDLPQSEFNRLSDNVPNFLGSKTLGEGAMF